MGPAIAAIGISLGAFAIFAVLITILMGGIGGGGGDDPIIICDMVGTVSGHVHDVSGIDKYVSVSSINLLKKDCHEKSIFDVFGSLFSTASPNQAALFVAGNADITVRLNDDTGSAIQDVKFTVTTQQFETEKDFIQTIKFTKLTQGESYTAVVFSEWENKQIKFSQQITV